MPRTTPRDPPEDDFEDEEDFEGYEPEYHPESEEAGELRCPKCSALIYADAVACPECGEYVTPGARPRRGLKGLFVLILAIIAAVLLLVAFSLR